MHCKAMLALLALCLGTTASAQRTHKPPLHGQDWMAVTGKPLGATAGAKIFLKGGNAVDAACAMLAATATMWDVLHWGGETQALIYNPHTKKVIGINALGVAPTGATPEFFKSKGMGYPPAYGPLAAVTPGTPGGLMVMLAEYGKLSLAEVLEPAIQLADGFPIEAQTVRQIVHPRNARRAHAVAGLEARDVPQRGRAARGRRRSSASPTSPRRCASWSRPSARRWPRARIARPRSWRPTIASIAATSRRSSSPRLRAQGGLFTEADLANWKVHIEEPVSTTLPRHRGLQAARSGQQGPVMLQALNILENFDLKSMGYNSARYIHTVYQAMNLAFADRDFYYGDPYFPPAEPMARAALEGIREGAREARSTRRRTTRRSRPAIPYPFQSGTNPYAELLKRWHEPHGLAAARAATPMAMSAA